MSATHPHPSHISFKGDLITDHKFTQWLCPFSRSPVTCHHTLLSLSQDCWRPRAQAWSQSSGALHTPSTAPQTLPPAPSLCTCTGWGSSGTDTGPGTGMSSFNHGGFFRCKLLVLSCRTSDIVPRLSSGLGEGRNHSQEGARLIPDTVRAGRAEQSALLQAVIDETQAPRWITSQSAS